MYEQLPACPVELTIVLIGNKWKVLILRDLMDGTKRFGALKKSMGSVSQKVLTSNLREMEECGLLKRKAYPEVPPKVEYTLTETGYSLITVLDAMHIWGENYKKQMNITTLEDNSFPPDAQIIHKEKYGGTYL